ncbi:MAG: hypothetical protein COX07_09555 [Bacteroidetes bacterium CG23_combo_of_CG06-09_8_20_14_all_32_9]|nr:MAG: hypothetical protein COX07_09555 [Bacteroidetes bacterium CG23_combo_of_CG06-09_8_20_14_all_32_9]
MKKIFITILFLFFSLLGSFGINIKSMEITYEHISLSTYKINLIVYSFSTSPVNSSFEVLIENDTNTINLNSIEYIGNYVNKCTYVLNYVFPGPGIYKISSWCYSHNTDVVNIPNPNTVPFYIETFLNINPFLGYNNSPVILNPLVDNACINHPYFYFPDVFDEEGDSVSYKLIKCKDSNGNDIAGYDFPQTTNIFSIDSVTGNLLWDSPIAQGIYAVAILIEEWRNGFKISSIMQTGEIQVNTCNTNFPIIKTISDTCVDAGSFINFEVNAIYPIGDSISLFAYGEVLHFINNPAQFNQPIIGIDSVSSTFLWQTLCANVRKEPYHVIFKTVTYKNTGQEEMLNNFNSSTIGSGWYSGNNPMFNDICSNSCDSSPYIWMGNNSATPRILQSPSYNLYSYSNNMICFDMRYSEQTGIYGSSCEGPDLPDEGVRFQYSTDGNSWISMEYYDPSIPSPGGHNPELTKWSTYCMSLPVNALTNNTSFRWLQIKCSGSNFDHWGLDNIRLFNIPQNNMNYKTVDITVVCPAPDSLTATPIVESIFITWKKVVCNNAIGYKIYRKNSYYGFSPANCETGVPGYTGYIEIANLTDINITNYTDNNNGVGLQHGIKYCYMIIAYFEDGAESYASNEDCAELPRNNVPVITNVSITHTHESYGSVYIAWSKPLTIDTAIYQGPYKYKIYRSKGIYGNNFVLIDSLYGINDTIYNDTLLNTKDTSFTYKIELYSGFDLMDSTIIASSVFLNIVPSDNKLELFWKENVPWSNVEYIVYKQNPYTLTFDSIASTNLTHYTDSGLVNEMLYCYKIKSIGHYSGISLIDPIINFSQENCAIPIDKTSPCSPQLNATTNCDLIENYLIWNNPNNTCADDVIKYYIYYSPSGINQMEIIGINESPFDTTYTHTNLSTIAAYYAVTAVDSFFNESNFSNIVTIDIDSCSQYSLPNVFTPNDDGINDLFMPCQNYFVEKVDMKIFNRWGVLVYQTEDPKINWDGKNMKSQKLCSDGVYYYVCDIYEKHLRGIEKRTLTGFIHLFSKISKKEKSIY